MTNTSITKRCPTCGIIKLRTDYYIGKNGKTPHQCKSCSAEKAKRANDKKRELRLAKQLIDDEIVAHVGEVLVSRKDARRIFNHINAVGSGCWEWTKGTNRGYGQPEVKKRPIYAHRLVYAIYYLTNPQKLHVLHQCDNPQCCNPLHLSLGTHQDNMSDRNRKGRQLKNRPCGEAMHNSVLTVEIVKQMRELHDDQKLSDAEIGKRFGISRSLVYSVTKRRNWAHI